MTEEDEKGASLSRYGMPMLTCYETASIAVMGPEASSEFFNINGSSKCLGKEQQTEQTS